MADKQTVTVEFPDGVREVEPVAWQRSLVPDRPLMPVFHASSYEIVETVDGRYIAFRKKLS